MGSSAKPYIELGTKLKKAREHRSESLAEVSYAVEIDLKELAHIENGVIAPSEDILLLLINHFGIKEDDAVSLWEMAGYDNRQDQRHNHQDEEDQRQNTIYVSPQDMRIVYTDMVHVVVNNYGVVINFMQGSGAGMQPLAISRIGMSKDHARSVLEVLKKTLEQADKPSVPKQLKP